ncbi:MAG: hypothetical protein KGP14_16490, partial [Betaproteobacteria bacterium]|nr:hypothetical protein [Betaproteobacteria bacterium]
MSQSTAIVRTTADLANACESEAITQIRVEGELGEVPRLRLNPGVTMQGADASARLRFVDGVDGICLTRDNRLEALQLHASDQQRAICNDTGVASLGTLVLKDVSARGQVSLVASEAVRSGHVVVDGLDVVSADCRHYGERPRGYGVAVVQGAFTLWNRSDDRTVLITADLSGISAGRPGAPVLGSGIFVSGGGDDGAVLQVSRLVTGAVHSTAGIEAGLADVISGGVFTVYGARVGLVHNLAEVVTYGQNDMVLDNWGSVDTWIAEAAVQSHGPSGVGFVNFGVLNDLVVNAPIETFGQGSRGFNVYDGTLRRATFDRIVTYADGAVGIQVSKTIDSLTVRRGIETFGGTGQSLVKGVMMDLAATPLSIKPGGSAKEIHISGGLISHGKGVQPLEMNGEIGSLHIDGAMVAAG